LPLVWGTTLLCILVAHTFRLNQVVLQSVNYFLYPLQLALLIPYCRLGARLFPWGPPFPAEIVTYVLHGHGGGMIKLVAWAMLKAVAAWLLTAPPLAFVLYLLFSMIIRGKRPPSLTVPQQ
jgi:hypothetical protein